MFVSRRGVRLVLQSRNPHGDVRHIERRKWTQAPRTRHVQSLLKRLAIQTWLCAEFLVDVVSVCVCLELY